MLRLRRGVFSRSAVARCDVEDPGRAKNLLWACAQLGNFAKTVGLELTDDCFRDSVIERLCLCGSAGRPLASVRTLRTNLRFVARRVRAPVVAPVPLGRNRSKLPYSEKEMAGFFRCADAQPTAARRSRANGLLALGAGAGLSGIDLRAVRGTDVVERSGGVLVCVSGRRARIVPVLSSVSERALDAAAFSGDDFIVGGVELSRRNVTSRLIASLSGGGGLPRLELPRLRATWLAAVGALIGLPSFMAAAGVSCSQRLGDVVGSLHVGSERDAVRLLGALR